jgi:hypothetical protein
MTISSDGEPLVQDLQRNTTITQMAERGAERRHKESLDKIAYYFDFDYMPSVAPIGYAAEVVSYVEAWRRSPELGMLSAINKSDGTLVLIDT